MPQRKYVLEVSIFEGNDEFWEELREKGTGCDEVVAQVREALANFGWTFPDAVVSLKSYTEDSGVR